MLLRDPEWGPDVILSDEPSPYASTTLLEQTYTEKDY
jgi:hypothetical protein